MAFEVGILFDIDDLGGGFYGWQAYKILFQALDPKRLSGCTFLDGDTAATLARRANHYCIAVQSPDPAPIQYVREILAGSQEKGLLPPAERFLEGIAGQPLVLAGVVDAQGRLTVKEGSIIGSGWTEGTAWSVAKQAGFRRDAGPSLGAGLSQAARIVNTFFAPSKTFTDIKRSASWWAPFLLISIVSYGFVAVVAKKVGWDQVTQNQIRLNPKAAERIEQLPAEQRAQQLRIQTAVTQGISYGFPVLNLLVLTIIAAVLMATFNFGAGAEIPFKQALAVVIYANLAGIVKALLAMVSLLAGSDPEGFNFQNPVATNLGYFVDPTTSRGLYSLASAVDIIAIWILVLTGIGFARISKLKTATTMGVVFGWYLLITLISAGLAAAFS